MTLRFRADAPKGQRLLALEVGGEPVEDERLYTVTACEREGDSPDMVCRIPGIQEPRVLDVDAHEAVLGADPCCPYVRQHRHRSPSIFSRGGPPGGILATERSPTGECQVSEEATW